MSTDEKIIKNKVGLLKLAKLLGSVSEACKVSVLVLVPLFANAKHLLDFAGSS
jgi:hypothetical protein